MRGLRSPQSSPADAWRQRRDARLACGRANEGDTVESQKVSSFVNGSDPPPIFLLVARFDLRGSSLGGG